MRTIVIGMLQKGYSIPGIAYFLGLTIEQVRDYLRPKF